jgi:SAM-dependent methyltransferase
MNRPEELPDAPACARNREPILEQLRRLLAHSRALLEIGSGTGQHAVYFAPRLPQLIWQTSDRAENLPGIAAWLAAEPAANLPPPLQLDVRAAWPEISVDTVFTANSLHIMSAEAVREFFGKLPRVLQPGGQLIVYGPVKIAGDYIGPGNAGFDQWLRERDPLSGLRDLEWLDELAAEIGLLRVENNYLPANNQLLVWRGRK